MRNGILSFFLVFLGVAAFGPARAQALPNQLIAGQVLGTTATNNNGGYCSVRTGASDIQIGAGLPTTGVISFPELIYWDGAYHDFSGQARMIFNSASSGNIRFKLWPKTNPPFSGYVSTAYAGGLYVVTFNIVFPNNCTLSIYGNYEAP
jgi:hypothetical protein